jgi:hypothetical protein
MKRVQTYSNVVLGVAFAVWLTFVGLTLAALGLGVVWLAKAVL